MSTSENLTNGQPSTLLRSIPVKNEKRGAGRTITFQVLQNTRLAAGSISQLTISLRGRGYRSSTSARPYTYEMVDAGGPGSVRKCPGVALADLGDVEWFSRS